MRLLPLLLLFPLAAVAGSIEGAVVDTLSGAPVPGARARIQPPQGEPLYARADDHGRFVASGLGPGPYSLKVQGIGHLQAESIAVVQGSDAPPVRLRIPLTPSATISGTVLDPNGFPPSSVIIDLFTSRRVQPGDERRRSDVVILPGGQTALERTDVIASVSGGKYRCGPLGPGSYFISVRGLPDSPEQNTYYPGVHDAAAALPVIVKPGEHLNIDLQMVPGAGVLVAGDVVSASGRPAPHGAYTNIDLTRSDGAVYHTSLPFAGTLAHPYAIHGVLPGTYTLKATTVVPADTPWTLRPAILGAVLHFEIGTRDMEGFPIRLEELPPIAGSVSFATGCAPVPVRIQLMPGGDTGSGPDGRFTLTGMHPGRLSLLITGTDAHPTSARLGDREVLGDGFDYPAPSAAAPLRIAMDCAHIGGRP